MEQATNQCAEAREVPFPDGYPIEKGGPKEIMKPIYEKYMIAEVRTVSSIQEAAHLMNTGEWMVTENCGSDKNGWKLILARIDVNRERTRERFFSERQGAQALRGQATQGNG